MRLFRKDLQSSLFPDGVSLCDPQHFWESSINKNIVKTLSGWTKGGRGWKWKACSDSQNFTGTKLVNKNYSVADITLHGNGRFRRWRAPEWRQVQRTEAPTTAKGSRALPLNGVCLGGLCKWLAGDFFIFSLLEGGWKLPYACPSAAFLEHQLAFSLRRFPGREDSAPGHIIPRTAPIPTLED